MPNVHDIATGTPTSVDEEGLILLISGDSQDRHLRFEVSNIPVQNLVKVPMREDNLPFEEAMRLSTCNALETFK